MEIQAKIVKTFPTPGSMRAVANVTIGGCFAVHGIKIIDSAKGVFVSMPNTKVGETYLDTFHPITKEAREQLNQTVMDAYEQYQRAQQTADHEQQEVPKPAYEMAM